MKKMMRHLYTIAAVSALLAVVDVMAQPFGSGRGAEALSPEAKQALTEALAGPDGEFAADALYSAILAKHGKVQPYLAIRDAERRHIQALKRQMQKYGMAVPEDKFAGKGVAPATLLEAAKQGVEAEEKNISMYDRYLAAVKDYPDLKRVFTNLQRASRDNHLPAFKAAATSTGTRNAPMKPTNMGHSPKCQSKDNCQENCQTKTCNGNGPTSK